MIKTYIDGVLQATPIVLRHNQLIGLNDDVNFQHITATDRTKLNNLSGINTGDETASTIINKIGDGSKINSNYLPSYVDDVLEFVNVASFPATGETGKIYIALDVNLTYRWGGSGYVEISPSVALGETSATAYRGDRGASAYAHSILTSGTNPHNTTFANIASKPTTIAGYGITDGAIQGTAYSNLENNVKIVQGVPAGGKMYSGAGTQTGAIKIKLPKNKSNAMFKFRVKINEYSQYNKQSNSEYIIKGYNQSAGVGYNPEVIATQQVTVVKDNASTMSPTFYFCTGATEDYILIGEITDTHNFKTVVVDDVEIHHAGISDDWSKDWAISLVTTLETLTSQYKVAVTPSLNATHLNGVQESTSATANTIVKRDANGAVTNSQYKLSALNTAPASPTATGTTGEIRVTNSGIYYCVATNTWRKALPVYIVTETITGLTSTFTNSTLPLVDSSFKYQWLINSGSHKGVIESTHNMFAGGNILSLVIGATVQTVTANSVFSVRIGDSVLEIKFDTGNGTVSYRIASGTITEITVNRLQHGVGW